MGAANLPSPEVEIEEPALSLPKGEYKGPDSARFVSRATCGTAPKPCNQSGG